MYSSLLVGIFVVLAGLVTKSEGQSCPPLTYSRNGLCYGLLQYPATFPQAATYCNVAGGSLATVSDQASFKFLAGVLRFMMASQYWIGLRRNQSMSYYYDPYDYGNNSSTTVADYPNAPTTWNGVWVFDNSSQAPATTFWGPNQPGYSSVFKGRGEVSCATLSLAQGNLWKSENCNATFGYICQVPKSSCCSGNKCYQLVNKGASYLQARQGCISLNGKLAEPQTAAEMLILIAMVNKQYSQVSDAQTILPYNGQQVSSGAWVVVPEVSNGPLLSGISLPWVSGNTASSMPPCGSCVYVTSTGLNLDYSCASYYKNRGNNNNYPYNNNYYNTYYGQSLNPICVYPQYPTLNDTCASS